MAGHAGTDARAASLKVANDLAPRLKTLSSSKMNKPPPIPNNQVDVNRPPVIPAEKTPYENPLLRLIFGTGRLWIGVAMIVGVLAGQTSDFLRAIADENTETALLFCATLAFAGLGTAALLYGFWHLKRCPTVERFFGMPRSSWLLGVPLAWLCGFVIGVLWRYV